jgi:protocatechuate 3,4-dioxygenase beta subunit
VGADRGDHKEGAFLVESLAEGEYALEIQASDFVTEALSGVRVTPGRVTDVGTIRLDRGGRIAGTVADSSGAPVAGATVEVETPGQRFFFNLGGGVSSDRQGRFEIRGVPEGTVGLVARHPSYSAARLDRVAVDPRSGPAEVEIVMRRGGAVEGYVRTRDGTDVAGRTVEAVPASSDFSIRDSVKVQTSEDGFFRFDHLPPGPAEVALLSTGTPMVYSVQSKPVTVVEGETAYVELVSRRILVHGQVKKGGLPLGGVELELWPTKGGRGMSVLYGGDASLRPKPSGPQYLAAITDADGFYELLVDDPGEYRLSASASGVGLPTKTVVVPDVDVFPLDLDYGGGSVSGRVVDRETESAVAGAWVSAQPTDPSLRFTGAGLQAGADGSFSLELDPGEYRLVVRSEGYATAERNVRAGEGGVSDLVIALSRGLEIRGRVVDSTGRGVPNLRIVGVEDMPDPRAVTATIGFATTLPDGGFLLGGLSRGAYNLLAHAGSIGGFGFAPGVVAGTEDVVLTLRPPGKIEIEVVDQDGASVPGAFVSVAAIDGRIARGVSGQTDAEGRLALTVPVGNLTIRAVLGNSPDVLGSVAAGPNGGGRARLEIPRREDR